MRQIYFKQLFVAFIALLCSLSATALTIKTDEGYRYKVIDDDALTVEFTSNGTRGYTDSIIVIPSKITYEGTTYDVVGIGSRAFRNSRNLKSVIIPSSVTSIAANAFASCPKLTSITIPESVETIDATAFAITGSLATVTFNNKVVADYGFTGLKNVIIGKGVTTVSNDAFAGCDSLGSIVVEDGNPVYDSRGNCNAIIETATNTLVKGCATTVIPENLESIGDRAFYGCLGLTSITLPESLTEISGVAFEGCTALETLTLNCKEIGDWGILLGVKSSVKKIVIGESVEKIHERALYGIDSLNTIEVKAGNAVYDSRGNCNAIIETATNTLVKGCATTVIPENVESIGNRAFYDCQGLTSINLPEGLKTIENSAFYNCTALANINFPQSITSIATGAFENSAWYQNLPDGEVYAGTILYCYKGTMPQGTTIEVKEGTKYIADGVFFWCSGLTGITLPESLKGIGKEAFTYCNNLTSVVIPNNVTTIGVRAFENCSDIKNLTIGNSVEYIGASAFYNCSSLTDIAISNSVTTIGDRAFENCSDIKNLTIGNGVEYIGAYAFDNCSSLTNVTLPNTLKTIEDCTFSRCSSLTDITIPASVNVIKTSAFSQCSSLANVTIGENVDTIYSGAFNATAITNVKIPAGVKSIKGNIFQECNNLVSIVVDENNSVYDSRNNCNAIIETATNTLVQGCNGTFIPEGVETIGAAFCGCHNIKKIEIPSTVTKIDANAFVYCVSLQSIVIPASVTSLNVSFMYCDNLKSIVVEDGNPVYDSRGNCNAIIETATNTLVQGSNAAIIPNGVTSVGKYAFCACSNLKNITIPESVTSIAEYAFGGCRALTNITIPSSVTSIGDGAFSGCVSLAGIELPGSITAIKRNTFNQCSALKNITIPESVTRIEYYAFGYCSSLEGISIPASVTEIDYEAFSHCTSLKWFNIEDGTTVLKSLGYSRSFFDSYCPLETLYLGRQIECYRLFDNNNNKFNTLTIGANVTSIRDISFSDCKALTKVYSLNPTPPVVHSSTFSWGKCILYVPYGSLEAYKKGGWGVYFKDIQEFNTTGVENVEEDAPCFEVAFGTLRFTNARGKCVAVYTSGGALVEKINSYAGEEIALDNGVYIICVGDKSVKVKL